MEIMGADEEGLHGTTPDSTQTASTMQKLDSHGSRREYQRGAAISEVLCVGQDGLSIEARM